MKRLDSISLTLFRLHAIAVTVPHFSNNETQTKAYTRLLSPRLLPTSETPVNSQDKTRQDQEAINIKHMQCPHGFSSHSQSQSNQSTQCLSVFWSHCKHSAAAMHSYVRQGKSQAAVDLNMKCMHAAESKTPRSRPPFNASAQRWDQEVIPFLLLKKLLLNSIGIATSHYEWCTHKHKSTFSLLDLYFKFITISVCEWMKNA